MLAHFRHALGYDSVYRRDDFAIRQIEQRLIELRARGLRCRTAAGRCGLPDGDLARRVLRGLFGALLRLQ